MSSPFDLSKTPTLQAVASTDEQILVQDLQKRLDEAVRQAEQNPEVVAALEAHRDAEAAHADLESATRNLNSFAKVLRDEIAVASGQAMESVIQQAATGQKPDFAAAGKVAALELSSRLLSMALQRLIEHMTPVARVAQFRAEAHASEARARAIEAVAQQRAEKVLGQMRDAVTDEVVLPIDMSKGVAGALLAQAAEFKRVAIEAATTADQLENGYIERNKQG